MAMTTRLRRFSVCSLLLVLGLSGCARMQETAQPPAWRRVGPAEPAPPPLPSPVDTFRA
jgi:hypothetical protein